MRFKSKPAHLNDASRLTYRLWDFTGTALLNLFMFIFLVAYLSPLPFMVIASLTPQNQFLDANAPILPSERVKFNYEGKDLIVYKVPTKDGVKQWALYKPSRQSSEFIDPANPEAGPILWEGNWRTLVFTAVPGPRLRLAAVTFPGATAFSTSRLIETAGGAATMMAEPQESVERVKQLYREDHYLTTKVHPPDVAETAGEVRVVMAIEEGPQAVVSEVTVEGSLAKDGTPTGNARSVVMAATGKRLFAGSSQGTTP